MRGLSLVAASGGHSSSRCAGLSLSWPRLLRSTGSRCAGSVVLAHGPSCSAACGIFPDQGLNSCPLHWQADSQPLRHQGSSQRDNFKGILLSCSEVLSGIEPVTWKGKSVMHPSLAFSFSLIHSPASLIPAPWDHLLKSFILGSALGESKEENGYMYMMAESLCCAPETITTLLISYTPI